MNCTVFRSFITALLLSGITTPQAILAMPDKDDESETLTSTMPAVQREAVASAALRTLRYITGARNAIHNKDLDQARQDVQQARELLSLIEATRPASRVKEHIWVVRQHMLYETNEDVIDDLTLIDAELLRLGDIIPTEKARRHLRNAQAAMKKNDPEVARQELDRLEASLIFTEFDLPLAACEQQVLAAQEALTRNQPATADKNLVAAEESIQFITLGGGAALVSVRTHLGRAAKNYHDEYFDAAKADLEQASEWLRRAGKDSDDKSRKEAQKLAAEIDALKARLDAETDDHTHTLSGFMHRSKALIEREAEELWLRYKRQQAANYTLRKLLDAKMHLYYAEHDLDKGLNTDVIIKELEITDSYLEEALDQAEAPVRGRINQLRTQIQALKEGLDGDRSQVQSNYKKAMADLVQLIHNH